MVSRTDAVQEMLLEEDYSILYHSRTLESTIDRLKEKQLVLTNPLCPQYNEANMNYIQDISKTDKLRLRCSNRACLSSKSFRWTTFLKIITFH